MTQKFNISENFLEKYKETEPDWGPLGEFTYLRCVTIDTPVLCDDFIWRPAGELKEGDGLIAFEEEKSIKKTRLLCGSTVTHNKIEKTNVMGIRLKNGKTLFSTPEHRWLCKVSPTDNRTLWVQTKDLISKNDRTPKFLPIWSNVWKAEESYEAGYLAAAFDGEGNLDRANGISFCQTENKMLETVEKYLNKLGIKYNKIEKKVGKQKLSFKSRKKIWTIRFYGKKNLTEFLGRIRPKRLLENYIKYIKEGNVCLWNKEYSEIIETWDAGEKEIAVLSTTSKTHFTDGIPSHNTYSRIKEDGYNEKWWETSARVVNGCFDIQKKHCASLRLPWSNYKAQKSAQIMYDKIFNFKFVPAGRSLWMQNTKFAEEKGGMSLFNCAFISTEDIDTRGSFSFVWTMDSLMLGVGVGADTKGSGKITIKQPKNGEGILNYVIPDSREGWVESVEILLDSYFLGKKKPIFDYSLIRAYGEPIKGFGGIASGPGPLKDLHKNIVKLLDDKVGEQIRSTDIVDIFNFIGVCVVAGNVRRCIPEYYEIEMADSSFKKIRDVNSGDFVSFNDKKYKVLNTFDNGKQETVRILTEDGYVESTKNHRWLTKFEGEVEWKTAEEISKNPTKYCLLSHI